jgi:hypothetical protein
MKTAHLNLILYLLSRPNGYLLADQIKYCIKTPYHDHSPPGFCPLAKQRLLFNHYFIF